MANEPITMTQLLMSFGIAFFYGVGMIVIVWNTREDRIWLVSILGCVALLSAIILIEVV